VSLPRLVTARSRLQPILIVLPSRLSLPAPVWLQNQDSPQLLVQLTDHHTPACHKTHHRHPTWDQQVQGPALLHQKPLTLRRLEQLLSLRQWNRCPGLLSLVHWLLPLCRSDTASQYIDKASVLHIHFYRFYRALPRHLQPIRSVADLWHVLRSISLFIIFRSWCLLATVSKTFLFVLTTFILTTTV